MEKQKEKVLVSVITPSYNEEENVEQVITRIAKALEGVSYEIVVEDDGDDKTAEIAKKLGEKLPVRVFHRDVEKMDLANAVFHGIGEARGEYICIIDADLQHPPEKISEMLEKAKETDADMVFASRYVPGGGSEGLSGPIRQLASRITKMLAYLIVEPSRKTTDPTGGFFLFKKKATRNCTLKPSGFKISIEILGRCNITKVEDIPYVFQDRVASKSKFNSKQALLFLKQLIDLFFEYPSYGRFIKFAIVGTSGTLINLLITAFLKNPLLSISSLDLAENTAENLSSATGIVISTLTNFSLNNIFTWKDLKATSKKEWLKMATLYSVGSSISGGTTYLVFTLIRGLGIHFVIAQSIGILAGMLINFFYSKIIVWRESKNEEV